MPLRSPAARFWLLTILIALALTVLNGRGELIVAFDLESASAEGPVVVYYDEGAGFAEGATARQPLRAGVQHYELHLPVSRIVALRIDPSTNDRTTMIRDVVVRRGATVIRRFDAAALVPARDIAESRVEAGGRGLRFAVRPGAQDPHFIVQGAALEAPALDAGRIGAFLAVAALIAAAVLLALALRAPGAPPEAAPVLAAFGIALGLAAALAILTTTRGSVSPDELNHVEAARYYIDHWLPPAVGEPASLASYSDYGASYLNEMDVVYLLAGKFVAASGFTGLDDVTRMRLFNVALLALCAVVALRSRLGRIAALPLLCSAQAWYVFAYFNADAIAIVAAVLLGTAVVTWIDRAGEPAPPANEVDWGWAIALGALLALCLLSKRTLYPFVPFVAGYALWRCGFQSRAAYALAVPGLLLLAFWYFTASPFPSVAALVPSLGVRVFIALLALALLAAAAWSGWRARAPGQRVPRTLLAAAGIGVAVFAVRVAVELAVNGLPMEKARALSELAERIARPDLRPSTFSLATSYAGVALAGKGVSLGRLLFGEYDWVSNVSQSFFGVYGYMTIRGPQWLYRAQYVFASLLLIAIAVSCLRERASRAALAFGAVGIVLTLELALFHSWVLDLQAQGRYVFAILPIVGLLLVEMDRHRVADPAGRRAEALALACVASLWVLAVASFAFVGLPGVTRA